MNYCHCSIRCDTICHCTVSTYRAGPSCWSASNLFCNGRNIVPTPLIITEMLRQCSYRGVRYARAVGLPPPPPFQGPLSAVVRLLPAEQLEPLLPVRYAGTLAKLNNSMQPEEIR